MIGVCVLEISEPYLNTAQNTTFTTDPCYFYLRYFSLSEYLVTHAPITSTGLIVNFQVHETHICQYSYKRNSVK
jgi:hypothetical protein